MPCANIRILQNKRYYLLHIKFYTFIKISVCAMYKTIVCGFNSRWPYTINVTHSSSSFDILSSCKLRNSIVTFGVFLISKRAIYLFTKDKTSSTKHMKELANIFKKQILFVLVT